MKKAILTSFKMLIVMTVVTGIIYPVLIWGYAQIFTADKANGSLIKKENTVIGSALIGQKFSKPQYFWSRPSAVDYNAAASGGSNLGPTSLTLQKKRDEQKELYSQHSSEPVPQDLVFSSGSGLDPDISVAAADYQVQRIATARNVEASTVRHLVQQLTEKPQFGILGETRVNVLKLNLALDKL